MTTGILLRARWAWDSSDADLIELAKRELLQIGLAREGDVIDGCVVRQKKAYRFMMTITRNTIVREEIEERYPNLHLVGRNGMHKYNNQDHAMLCVKNILADAKPYDLWQVNGDAEYHEAGKRDITGTASPCADSGRERGEPGVRNGPGSAGLIPRRLPSAGRST